MEVYVQTRCGETVYLSSPEGIKVDCLYPCLR